MLPYQAQPKVPVLALGGGLTMLGVLRSLGRAGIPVFTLCDSPGFDFCYHSRWYRELAGKRRVGPNELASFLESLPLERVVLMPCADDWLESVSTLPSALASRFPTSLPPSLTVQSMVDKWRFAQLLRGLDTPSPETHLVESVEQLESLLAPTFEAKILKPLSSKRFRGKYGVKGYVVNDRAEALRIMSKTDLPIMLQEYIPGPPSTTFQIDGFVDRCGELKASFVRQRLRLYPPHLGNSSFMMSVPVEQVASAAESLRRILRATSYRGIFSAEFKYDSRDQRFKIIEINARPWWYIEFAARCGVDVCRMAYLDALEMPVDPIFEYQTGRRCVNLINDIRCFRYMYANEEIGFFDWIRSSTGACGTLFVWDDPGPAFAAVGRVLWKRLRRLPEVMDLIRKPFPIRKVSEGTYPEVIRDSTTTDN